MQSLTALCNECCGALATLNGQIGTATLRRGRPFLRQRRADEIVVKRTTERKRFMFAYKLVPTGASVTKKRCIVSNLEYALHKRAFIGLHYYVPRRMLSCGKA
jgi:hypothetical protein